MFELFLRIIVYDTLMLLTLSVKKRILWEKCFYKNCLVQQDV